MSLGGWFRRRFSSPTTAAAEDAALEEEFGAPPDVDEANVDRMADPKDATAPGGLAPGLPATPAAAEAAEGEIAAQEPPPPPGP